MAYYYKSQDGTPVSSEYQIPDLTSITEEEYNGLVRRKEVCRQIDELKFELKRTDYVVLKIAEARTEQEKNLIYDAYGEVIARRIEIRATINELEGELE